MVRDQSPALVVAVIALIVALGGTGYAVTQLEPNSVGAAQIRDDAVTTEEVKDRSLRAKDFRRGSLPRGRTGPQGPQGPRGEAGTPADTSQFFTRTESDARFLAAGATAANADRLDGLHALSFRRRQASGSDSAEVELGRIGGLILRGGCVAGNAELTAQSDVAGASLIGSYVSNFGDAMLLRDYSMAVGENFDLDNPGPNANDGGGTFTFDSSLGVVTVTFGFMHDSPGGGSPGYCLVAGTALFAPA